MKKTRNIIGTICGVLAVVGAFAAVCVMDGSAHETAIRCAGAITFAVFALAWAALKGGEA